jgi:hypothetical protein
VQFSGAYIWIRILHKNAPSGPLEGHTSYSKTNNLPTTLYISSFPQRRKFRQNGRFILNLASMQAQTTWVIKPHPDFDYRVVADGIMTQQELDEYYGEWDQYGTIFRGGGDFHSLKTSDCLITVCTSLLADYLPIGKSVFLLRSKAQTTPFSDFAENTNGAYCQIHSNTEFEKLFSQVMIEGNDFTTRRRLEQIADLKLTSNETATKCIFDHVQKELKIT